MKIDHIGYGILLIGVLALLWGYRDGLSLLFWKNPDYPNFDPGRMRKWRFIIVALMGALLVVLAARTLVSTVSDFDSYKLQEDAVRIAREENRLIAIKNEARRREKERVDGRFRKQEIRIERLEAQGFQTIVVKEIPEASTQLTIGTRVQSLGTFPSDEDVETVEETIVIADDQFGNEQLVLVYHLFPGTAFWEFKSTSSFVDSGGRQVDFLKVLHSPAFAEELTQFDILIGLGLSSNTTINPDAIAEARAALLCGALYAKEIQNPNTRTFGLSIGHYTGPEREGGSIRVKSQRSVVIVGVKVLTDSADEKTLITEILEQVDLRAIDLTMFSKLRSPSNPVWLEAAQCVPNLKRR